MASHPTLTEHFTKAAQSFPDKWALPVGKFEISHSCLQELIAVLRSAGVSPDDVVVLPFPNSIEAQAAASKPGITLVTVSLSNPIGPVHFFMSTLNGDSTHGLVHDFSNDASDGVLLFNNSGTTSRPKVIALTQHNLAALVQSIPSEYRVTHSDLTVGVLPMFYVHGLLAGLLSPLSAGGSVTLASLGQFSASTFWGDMHKPGSVDKPVGQELAVLDDKGVPQPTGVAGEHTGHLGYLNEDGYLHLVGRVKELINNGGSFHDDHVTADVVVPISVLTVNQISPPEGSEHNTGSAPTDLEAGQPNQTSQPEIADPTSNPNRSNGIWQLMYITAGNFVTNTMVGVLYLGKKPSGV